MGAKTGYASEILALFGLTAGQGADAYLWCEPDDGARVLLQALPQPDVLKEAAAILHGWSSEDPKTLWDSLRDEGAPKGVDGREVARWQFLLGSMWVHKQDGRPISGWQWCERKPGIKNHARRLEDDLPPMPPSVIATDARAVDPREVARFILTGVWSYKQGRPDSGFVGPGMRRQDTTATATATATATLALCVQNWPPVCVQNDALLAEPCDLPNGTVCFIDPPYVATTGYKHDLGRAEVVDLAVRWANAGAFVGVSEQAPVEELIALGWHAVNLTNGRKGQKRTFSKQQEEWVTLSRPPVHVPLLGSQPSLFGGARG